MLRLILLFLLLLPEWGICLITPPIKDSISPELDTVIGSFQGILPAADCKGMQVTLNLFYNPETGLQRLYYIETYLSTHEGDITFEANGTWLKETTTVNDKEITLYHLQVDNHPDSIYLLIISDNELQMLNSDKKPFPKPKKFTLKRLN